MEEEGVTKNIKGRQGMAAFDFCAMSRGRRDYLLGFGEVLCAEAGVS